MSAVIRDDVLVLIEWDAVDGVGLVADCAVDSLDWPVLEFAGSVYAAVAIK